MMILIAYATVEGHTADVAERIARAVEQAGHEVILTDLAQPGFAVPGRFDAVVLCGSIHMGRYSSGLIQFVQNWKQALSEVPSALVTVSLGIASEQEQERKEAEAYPERLTKETGWEPDQILNVAGALKFVEYDFFKRWIMLRIAVAEGGPVDTTRDHVLTDWEAVDSFAHSFLAFAAKGAQRVGMG